MDVYKKELDVKAKIKYNGMLSINQTSLHPPWISRTTSKEK